MTTDSKPQPHFALVFFLVWLAIVGQLLWWHWTNTAQFFSDPDDAMRLVEVRAFLAGRGWFDLHEPRIQPPIGHDSHWSRLIDAGLGGLFLVLRLAADTASAERLMRVTWPLLWLIPAIAAIVTLAWRLAGRPAALVALLILFFGLPAFGQFLPGRIDHHNVQVTLALLCAAATAWADRIPWAAGAAGAVSGLALAIGLEAMPLIVVVGGVLVVRYVVDRNAAPALATYGLSIAASTTLAFVVSVAPERWTETMCYAIAINFAAPAALGGLGLGIAGWHFADDRLWVRCSAIIAILIFVALLFVLLEPRCLGGPNATFDPVMRTIWLNHINESQSIFVLSPTLLAHVAVYPVISIFSGILLARDANARRNAGFVVSGTGLLVGSALMMMAGVRFSAYAIWFGIPLVSAALLRLFSRMKLVTVGAMALVAIPFTPMALMTGVLGIAQTVSTPKTIPNYDLACFLIETYAALARLQPGLVVTAIDYGPLVLALTPHSVLGAPYPLSHGVVASHLAFASPPEAAQKILRDVKATYVMTCGSRPPWNLTASEERTSLWGQLQAGSIPDWLERLPDTGKFAVYRFMP